MSLFNIKQWQIFWINLISTNIFWLLKVIQHQDATSNHDGEFISVSLTLKARKCKFMGENSEIWISHTQIYTRVYISRVLSVDNVSCSVVVSILVLVAAHIPLLNSNISTCVAWLRQETFNSCCSEQDTWVSERAPLTISCDGQFL